MKIKIADAVNRFGTQRKLAEMLGLPEQSISNRKRKSEYLTESQALKLHHRHPAITRELLAKRK